MPSCNLAGVSISFGHRTILENVGFSLSGTDRVALTGANGSGKSTLLKIIAGILAPDTGKVTFERETRVSYLPQSGVQAALPTLYAEAESAYSFAKALVDKMSELEEKLSSCNEESDTANALLARHQELADKISALDYHSRKREITRVLSGLGFGEEDFEKSVKSFSSGWQMRIALARVLLERPDILLLDEPTNYLDLEARNWLESYLADFCGSALIVSHDRYFLDRNVHAVAEIYLRKLTLYRGNYTAYEARREQELESINKAYEEQQEEIAKTELFIRRFRYNSSKARLVQSRILYLEKLVPIEKPPAMRTMHFSFPPPPASGECSLDVRSLAKTYGGKRALDSVSFTLMKGERLVLVGPNGAGKTTLIKTIAGLLPPDSGEIIYGKGITAGTFLQDHLESASEETSIIEKIESIAPTNLFPKLRMLLGAFLFSGDEIHKQVSVLSGGEKSRLLLIELLLKPANLLLLDEPTNHLDLVSKDVLLDALKSCNATLIFVSHDPYFIMSCATKVLELDMGKATYYYGDYEYYLYRKDHRDELQDVPRQQEHRTITQSEGKLQREEENKRRNLIKKLEMHNEEVFGKIEEKEAILRGLEAQMSDPEIYTSGERMKDLKKRIAEEKNSYNAFVHAWEDNEKKLKELRSEIE